MGRYTNCTCDHCGKILTDSDDIVICPVCGAPQHRACYNAHHACPHEGQHASGYEWQFPSSGEGARITCRHCGAQNPSNAAACQLCGAPLGDKDDSGNRFEEFRQETERAYTERTFTPDFTVEDVSSDELKSYFGNASQKLIPRFNIILQQKFNPAVWNIPAFIFGPFYLLYRKVKTPAYLLILLMVLLHVPGFAYSIELFKAYYAPQMFNITLEYSETLLRVLPAVVNIAGVLRLIMHIGCCFFANRFLLDTAIDDIRDMHTKYSPAERGSNEYHRALFFRGNPTLSRPILWAVALMFITYAIVSAIIMPLISV